MRASRPNRAFRHVERAEEAREHEVNLFRLKLRTREDVYERLAKMRVRMDRGVRLAQKDNPRPTRADGNTRFECHERSGKDMHPYSFGDRYEALTDRVRICQGVLVRDARQALGQVQPVGFVDIVGHLGIPLT